MTSFACYIRRPQNAAMEADDAAMEASLKAYQDYTQLVSVPMKEQVILLPWASSTPNATVDSIAVHHAEMVVDASGSSASGSSDACCKSPLHARLGLADIDGTTSVAQYIWLDVLKPTVDRVNLNNVDPTSMWQSADCFTLALLNEVSCLSSSVRERLICEVVVTPTVRFGFTETARIRLDSLPPNLAEELPNLKCAVFIIGDNGFYNALFAITTEKKLSDGYAFVYADTMKDRPLSRNVAYIGHYLASVLRKAPARKLTHVRVGDIPTGKAQTGFNNLMTIGCVTAGIRAVMTEEAADSSAIEKATSAIRESEATFIPVDRADEIIGRLRTTITEQLKFVNQPKSPTYEIEPMSADDGTNIEVSNDDEAECAAYLKTDYGPAIRSKLFTDRIIKDASMPPTRFLRGFFGLGVTGRVKGTYQPYYSLTEDWIKWKVAEIYSDKSLNKAAKDHKIADTLTEETVKAKLTQTFAKRNTTLDAVKAAAAAPKVVPPSAGKRPRSHAKRQKVESDEPEAEDTEADDDSDKTVTDGEDGDADAEAEADVDIFTQAASIVRELKKTAKRQAGLFGLLEALLKDAASAGGDS